MRRRSMTATVATLAVGLTLAACGDDEIDDVADLDQEQAPVALAGNFDTVPDAPTQLDRVAGNAELVVTDSASEASIVAEGLEPDSEYFAHVHIDACNAEDPGGPHFKFDPDGGDEPPNEIHLRFTTDGEGAGTAESRVEQAVPEGEAKSIVLHGPDGEGGETKLACADLR